MSQFCNLVVEFNGLVSKQGQQQCWPFYMPATAAFQKIQHFFLRTISFKNSSSFIHDFIILCCLIFLHERTHEITIIFIK